jgi:hypothetical protein
MCATLSSIPSMTHALQHTDPNVIIAEATVCGVLIAILGLIASIMTLIVQTRLALRQSRVELLLKVNDDFDADQMQEARATAAKTILKSRAGDKVDMSDVDDVLDFFETVALLVRRKALIEEFVWHSFLYWMRRYFLLCKDYIDTIQKKPDERSRWEDMVWLYPRLLRIEKEKNNCSDADLKLSQEDLDNFLKEEVSLTNKLYSGGK